MRKTNVETLETVKFFFSSSMFYYFPLSIEFIGVTVINKTIQVSGAQFCNTSLAHGVLTTPSPGLIGKPWLLSGLPGQSKLEAENDGVGQ